MIIDFTKPWTKEQKMLYYGITEEDLKADVESLSAEKCYWRFFIEFGGDFGRYWSSGEYGYSDGTNFRLRPDNVTDEDEDALRRESLKQKKNLFIEQWTNIAQFDDDEDADD